MIFWRILSPQKNETFNHIFLLLGQHDPAIKQLWLMSGVFRDISWWELMLYVYMYIYKLEYSSDYFFHNHGLYLQNNLVGGGSGELCCFWIFNNV